MFDILNELKSINLVELGKVLKIEQARNKLLSLQGNYSITALQQVRQIQTKLNKYDTLCSIWQSLYDLVEISIKDNDYSLLEECRQELNTIFQTYNEIKLEALFKGKYDSNNAIITLHAGAGGTEAQDWCSMLYRMYTAWAEKNSFNIEIFNYLPGDVAGIKSVTFQITGENAYGWLKNENGIHRLVRISPFDAASRRHTSFASVGVMPEINNDTNIVINPEDLEVDTFRASGAGGQHVNKTESAVRITHVPSGLIVACQSERSQHQNRATAMKILKSKLVELMEQQHKDNIEEIRGVKNEIAWGSQIRSYVFHPYSMVKDHRTDYETGNIAKFIDGGIDECLQINLTKLNN